MPRLSKIGAAALAAFGWTSGGGVTASYLVVAGGGGGGAGTSGVVEGGGGGAGGYRTSTASLNPTLSYTVTVGAGGTSNTNGSDSIFSATTSTGGGAGGRNGTTSGSTGGSGGGAGGVTAAGANGNTPSTSPSQGNNGGTGIGIPVYASAGGGGAGAVGGTAVSAPGAGGAGTANSITGSSVTYGGGGGGTQGGTTSGAGGAGGGGAGATSGNGSPGTANLGGGGGAGSSVGSGAGGQGGSGVVIISYPGAQQFGGGNVTTDGTNTIHTFTTSGTLSPLSSLTASALVVAGGGGGAGATTNATAGCGAGAGGLLTSSSLIIDTNSNYVVTVGAGGAGGASGGANNGVQGSGSSFLSLTTAGGGYGAASGNAGAAGGSGGSGGSGGGTAANTTGGAGNTPSTSPSQGNNGGISTQTSDYGGAMAGGGGAGAVGGNGASQTGGNGGVGVANSINGTSTYYAGGGGGAGNTTKGTGGNGGGGNGGQGGATTATSGTANTGGGGGGSSGNGGAGAGGSGGSGVVIIAYPGSTQQMAGGTVTISGGNVIHTFTSSGYLTPIKYASRSLRFRSSASAYISRTPATTTNRRTWTWSGWVKRGALGSVTRFFSADNGAQQTLLRFQADNTLQFQIYNSGVAAQIITTQVFRDPSAWYHIVAVMNTTDATSANRMVLYINGVQVTALSTASYPSQNYDAFVNQTILHSTSSTGTAEYWDGYLTEVNFVDGAALTPSSFGTFNSYGVWQPITYGGSYGTNGFYLTFGNNTSTTTLGYDTSPQGNNWTTNNFSLTTGATYDSMTDVPTLTSATVANYCTWNPLARFTGANAPTISNGNLLTTTAGNPTHTIGTIALPASGKFYFEVTCTSLDTVRTWIGFLTTQTNAFASGGTASYNLTYSALYAASDGYIYYNTGSSAYATYGATYTTGDVIGIAYDNGKIWWSKNGTWQASGNPATGANPGLTGWNVYGDLYPYCGYSSTFSGNFGQQPFTYTAPTGFVALNTYNLSTPTIPNGAKQMNAVLYTGTGALTTRTGLAFDTAPSLIWIKGRSGATDHVIEDSVSTTAYLRYPNLTNADGATGGGWIQNFATTGFSTDANGPINTSAATYVAWAWAGNGSGVSNTSGSITSTVSANTTAGFSVVTYTGNGTSGATVGHGLGVAPAMIIVKNRSGTNYWIVWQQSLTSIGWNLYLNTTDSQQNDNQFQAKSSTTFTISNGASVNTNTNTYVAYVFAAVAGYSAFGSYTGNGSADGPFVYLGFRPRWVLIRSTTGARDWLLYDTSRLYYNNGAEGPLVPDTSGTPLTGPYLNLDILSNGFKVRDSVTNLNASGETMIYAAFAENPFKYSNAR